MNPEKMRRDLYRAYKSGFLGGPPVEKVVTENAADLFHAWLISQGWMEPPVDPEGCGACEFRAAMVRALKEGQ